MLNSNYLVAAMDWICGRAAIAFEVVSYETATGTAACVVLIIWLLQWIAFEIRKASYSLRSYLFKFVLLGFVLMGLMYLTERI